MEYAVMPMTSVQASRSGPSSARPLSWHLAILTLVLTIPMLGLIVFLGLSFVRSEQARLESESRAVGRHVGDLVESALAAESAVLQSLAQAISGLDPETLEAVLLSMASSGRPLLVHDANGARRAGLDAKGFDGLHQGGLELTLASLAARSRDAKAATVSDLVSANDGHFVILTVAGPSRGEPRFLSTLIQPIRFRDVLLASGLARSEGSTLVDGQGMIIARWRNHESFVGKPMPAAGRSVLLAGEDVWRGVNLEGQLVLVTHQRIAALGWTVGTGVSGERLARPAGIAMISVAPAAIGLLGLAFFGTLIITRRINGSLRALSESASAVGRGEVVRPVATRVAEIDAVGAALALSSRQLEEQRHRLERIALSAPNIIYIHDLVAGGNLYANQQIEAALGYTPAEIVAMPDGFLAEMLHPDDAERVAGEMQLMRSVSDGEVKEIEYRLRHRDGSWRWFLSRDVAFQRNTDGMVTQILGAAVDITAAKAAVEERSFLMREMHHRVTNTLAQVRALVSASLRSAGSLAGFNSTFQARMAALASTHDVLSDTGRRATELAEIVQGELAPFHTDVSQRLRISDPSILLPSDTAAAMTLAIHELTTNAVKYGSLSVPDGALDVVWAVEPRNGRAWLDLTWREYGGPPVAPPTRRGFGSRLLQRTMDKHPEASTELLFEPDGVRFRLQAPLADH